MRQLIDLAEAAAPPAWFQSGRIVDINDPEFDAAEFLEGDEFDYEWRLCEVPAQLLTRISRLDVEGRIAKMMTQGATDAEERERFDSLRRLFVQKGAAAALHRLPIILLITRHGPECLDGWHRLTLAIHEAHLSEIPALVAFGERCE